MKNIILLLSILIAQMSFSEISTTRLAPHLESVNGNFKLIYYFNSSKNFSDYERLMEELELNDSDELNLKASVAAKCFQESRKVSGTKFYKSIVNKHINDLDTTFTLTASEVKTFEQQRAKTVKTIDSHCTLQTTDLEKALEAIGLTSKEDKEIALDIFIHYGAMY